MRPLAGIGRVLFRGLIEPAQVATRRRTRLAVFDHPAGEAVDLVQADRCTGAAGICRRQRRGSHHVGGGRWRPMPMVLALTDMAALDAAIRARSDRTLTKIRRAARSGFAVHRFPIRRHVHDVHAIRTSMRRRSGGPVLDAWLLRPHQIARPAEGRVGLDPFRCPVHWVQWWGVFEPAPGHDQNGVTVDERLVGFVKLTRTGDLIHYTEIMGHRDWLRRDVMHLLHREIVRWAVESGETEAAGARLLLYGALEHGNDGLLTWKRRAGFVPARLSASPTRSASP